MIVIDRPGGLRRLPGPVPYPEAEGYIYVAGFRGDLVKVGRTSNPSARMANHKATGEAFGVPLSFVWVSRAHVEHAQNERMLVGWAERHARSRRGAEYFAGIDAREVASYAASLPMTRLNRAAHRQRRDEEYKKFSDRMNKVFGINDLIRLPKFDADDFPRRNCDSDAIAEARARLLEIAPSQVASLGPDVHRRLDDLLAAFYTATTRLDMFAELMDEAEDLKDFVFSELSLLKKEIHKRMGGVEPLDLSTPLLRPVDGGESA